MRNFILPISLSLLVLSLMSCSLVTPGTQPTPTPISIPPSGYEPQPGDDKLTRDQVFLDLENSQVLVMESMPVQVSVILNGNLSDPCHELRVVVTPANAQNKINMEVYSVVDSSKACITVLQPFTATILLGSFPAGHYTVYANGQLVGEFDG